MSTMLQLKRILTCTALVAGAVLSPSANAVPLLIGSATLNAADDLTVIQNGAQVLEFLDVSLTTGQSVASALATYGSNGFHWATGVEISQLFDAFGFAYNSAPQQPVFLNVPGANAASFISYLGTTVGDAAAGWVDDNTTATFHSYLCVSVTTCSPNAFVENTLFGWPSDPSLGVFLVRDGQRQLPEPSTFAIACVAIAAALRKQGSKRKLSA